LKNLFGYGDIWDASGSFGWDQTTEVGVGVCLPRFKSIPTPLMARASLSSQDWLKFSSYKERLLGLSFGLLSTRNHDLSYNLAWRTLTDPSRVSSKAIRRQLGHNLLSALKYTYKIDKRDSHLRPTKGYAFQSTSQVGGLWNSKGLRYFRQVILLPFMSYFLLCLALTVHGRNYEIIASVYNFIWSSQFWPSLLQKYCRWVCSQEFDVRGAVPLGFYSAALNVGVGAGVILPLAGGFMNSTSSVPERFYLGGNSSPVCSLGGPSSLLGFRLRGVGPTEARRHVLNNSESGSADPGRDYLGGDLAVSAFADLSFDLPLKIFRDAGIHGHAFLTAGNLAKLSEGEYKNFSASEFRQTFRSSAGVGIILPTKLFRVEVYFLPHLQAFDFDTLDVHSTASRLTCIFFIQVNYCRILKQAEHDSAKTGIQFSFSSPM
jgi:outer membrane protein insertion porin family